MDSESEANEPPCRGIERTAVKCPTCGKGPIQLKTLTYTHRCAQSFDVQERIERVKRKQEHLDRPRANKEHLNILRASQEQGRAAQDIPHGAQAAAKYSHFHLF